MASTINLATTRERLLCKDNGSAAIAARRLRLDEPHVRELTEWVESVRARLDSCHADTVCDVDPFGGGSGARVLYLAQDPSSTASATGFISPDNNDATARATTEACREAGIADHERIHWNVYPWWLDAPCDEIVPNADDLAGRMLAEFLDLVPEVVSVVLIGGKAEKSWKRLAARTRIRPNLRIWDAPHPSFGWWGKPYKPGTDGRLGRVVAVEALRSARAHAFP